MATVECRNLGTIGYGAGVRAQQEVFDRLLEGKSQAARNSVEWKAEPAATAANTCLGSDAGVLFLCEHPHVYTLGKSGQEANMLIDPAFLERIGAEFHRTDRGGDITYHGPGQLVGYPVVDLEKLGIGLKEYINRIEQAIIDTLASFGIEAERSEGAAGVWLPARDTKALRKICAIGVRSSRFVTMHGFALNVNPCMEYFTYINPCGFTDRGVTSIEKETGSAPSMEEVASAFTANFARVFGVQVQEL